MVCPAGAESLPPGELALVTVVLGDDIVATGETGQAIYAYVVDRDGDSNNDWLPQWDFDWDLFQGTDTWVELTGDLDAGTWQLRVSEVTPDQQVQPATLPVRAIVRGSTVVFVVPASALPPDAPYRVTAFVHDGSYAPEASGGDVSGVDPTQPLSRD